MTSPKEEALGAENAQLRRFIRLEKRVREAADRRELSFMMVNDAFAVVPYRQAALWWRPPVRKGEQPAAGRIEALSGASEPAKHGSFPTWLASVMERHGKMAAKGKCSLMLPTEAERPNWNEYLPKYGLWVPLPTGTDEIEAAVGYWRDEPWTSADAQVLYDLGSAFADAWRRLDGSCDAWMGTTTASRLAHHFRNFMRRRAVQAAALLVILGISAIPIRQSALAPAEVVPSNPFTVRAPIEGVVEGIVVKPNAPVKQGDLIVKLEARDLMGRLEAAREQLAVADAQLRQAQQQAFSDARSKTTLGVLERRRRQAEADVRFLEGELARTEIRAERDGVAVFTSAEEWSGRPVALGERILTIADPEKIELAAEIPAGDMIALASGDEVRFFLNAAPLSPVEATLRTVAYRAEPQADGTLAYEAKADFTGEADRGNLRIGLKGTAKIYGDRAPLIFYLLRKPLATLRIWLGI